MNIRIAAIEVALYDFPDSRPEVIILPLKTVTVFGGEAIERMEQRPAFPATGG